MVAPNVIFKRTSKLDEHFPRNLIMLLPKMTSQYLEEAVWRRRLFPDYIIVRATLHYQIVTEAPSQVGAHLRLEIPDYEHDTEQESSPK